MNYVEIILADSMRVIGFILSLGGLWVVTRGLRVVVSCRIDEKRSSAGEFRRGIPILVVGLLLLFGANLIEHWIS